MYLVISPVKPPADWGFKPNRWFSRYFKATPSKLHAAQLLRDLHRLELYSAKILKIPTT
jgi:hypothetical protein